MGVRGGGAAVFAPSQGGGGCAKAGGRADARQWGTRKQLPCVAHQRPLCANSTPFLRTQDAARSVHAHFRDLHRTPWWCKVRDKLRPARLDLPREHLRPPDLCSPCQHSTAPHLLTCPHHTLSTPSRHHTPPITPPPSPHHTSPTPSHHLLQSHLHHTPPAAERDHPRGRAHARGLLRLLRLRHRAHPWPAAGLRAGRRTPGPQGAAGALGLPQPAGGRAPRGRTDAAPTRLPAAAGGAARPERSQPDAPVGASRALRVFVL